MWSRRSLFLYVLFWIATSARAQSNLRPAAELDSLVVRFEAGDFSGALQLGRELIAQPLESTELIRALNYLGATCYQLAKYDEAVLHLGRALSEVSKHEASPEQRASLLSDLGESLRAAGDFDAAVDTLEAGLRLIRQVGPGTELHAQILNNAAGLHRDQGNFAQAEEFLREALRLSEERPVSGGERLATAHLNLAELLRFQSRYAESQPHYEEALEIARESFPALHPHLVFFLNQFAALLSEQGSFAEANALRLEALRILEAPENASDGSSAYPILQALLLSDRAKDALDQGNSAEAVAACEQALALRRRIYTAEHWELGASQVRLARALLEAGSAGASAIANLASEALLTLERTVVSPEMRADAYAVRGLARLRQNHMDDAAEDLDQAIEIVEQLRVSHGGGDESRARLLVRHYSYYDEAVHLALREGNPSRAVDLIERFRARAMQERLLLDEQRLLASVPDSTRGPLRQRVRQAEARLVAIQDRQLALAFDAGLRAEERQPRLAALETELEFAIREFTAAQEQIRMQSSAWQNLVHDRPTVSLRQIQAALEPGELMLLYWVGPAHGWLVEIPPQQKSARSWELEIAASEAAALGVDSGPLTLQRLSKLLAGSHGGYQAGPWFEPTRGVLLGGAADSTSAQAARARSNSRECLHSLWKVLAPQATWSQWKKARELVILPAGPLHALPFEALIVAPPKDGNIHYWLDDGPPLRYADSAATLLQIAEAAESTHSYPAVDVLSVSNPEFAMPLEPLPGTEQESQLVTQALGSERVQFLAKTAATETAVRAASVDKRYLHLATHGFVEDETSDVLAGLALARSSSNANDDGRLQLFEIDALNLDAQLAVLSACRTAAGKRVESEGVFALSRGFHVAGALRVVASLWSVSDASTAVLVGDLFERIADAERSGGAIPYAQALRDAKRAIRSRREWSEPFYWAPFLLSGAR